MRPGGERRGNSQDRARRRAWLLEAYAEDDLPAGQVRCQLASSAFCLEVVDATTLTVDRVTPGGSYARYNIQPACRPCQLEQGALITNERRRTWRDLMAEAQDRGIEWDGTL